MPSNSFSTRLANKTVANGLHRALAGISGVGKTTLLLDLCSLFCCCFHELLVLYVDYAKGRALPSRLLVEAMRKRGCRVDTEVKADNIVDVLGEMQRLGLRAVFVADDVHRMFYSQSPQTEPLIKQASGILNQLQTMGSGNTALLVLSGSALRLGDFLYGNAYEFYGINFNDTRVRPLRALPLTDRNEFKAALEAIGHDSNK